MDNFCEIEIKKKWLFTYTKKQGLLFDLYAWFLLWQSYGWDFNALSHKNVDELSSAMLYTGALSWNRFNGIRVDFTKEEVQKWADNLSVGKMKELGRVLLESMKVMEEIKAGAGVEKKK